MLKNDSSFYLAQSEGACYSVDKLEGYYNDLRGKVESTKHIDENDLPFNIASLGNEKKTIYFPTAVFQYGLGAYDLYLETKDNDYLNKMLACADYAVNNQEENGGWDDFGMLGYSCPYSAMAQGEGASLLTRAFKETKDEKYLTSAVNAVDFMLKSKTDGGTAEIIDDCVFLYEYPDKPLVLNGWIFASFGLLDVYKVTGDKKYLEFWQKSVNGIKLNINRFDAPHWSCYDVAGKYTSPFYHSLHIELLKALNKLTHDDVFEKYIAKWSKDRSNGIYSKLAFVIKAKQKLSENKSAEWVIVE